MDNERIIIVAGITALATIVGTFILWGPSTTTVRSRRRGAVIGLQNLGLTCYLNSLLQALASCHFFVEWLNRQETEGDVTTAMRRILNVIAGYSPPWTDEDFISPVDLIPALSRSGWKITNSQQDVHELLCNLITILEEEAHTTCVMISADSLSKVEDTCDEVCDTLLENGSHKFDSVGHEVTSHKDLNGFHRWANNGILSEPCSPTCSMPELTSPTKSWHGSFFRSRTAYDLNQRLKPSPFRGYIINKIECTKCNYKSVLRYDKFDHISLHLPESFDRNIHSLHELLENFIKYEIISDVMCEGCNKNRPPDVKPITASAVKLVRFGKLPSSLCIHISRTAFHEYGIYKRQDYVEFPEYIAMDPFMYKPRKNNAFTVNKEIMNWDDVDEDDDSRSSRISNGSTPPKHIYRLKAVIVHRGSHNDGHFMTYRRGTATSQTRHRCSDTRWYLVSDKDVRETTLYNVLSSVAYFLFYEKCTEL